MTFLPTDPAVAYVVHHGRGGHPDYDRGIRDHMADARPGDPYGQTYWWHRALVLAHLGRMGQRYNAPLETIACARRCAIESLRPYGNARALGDLEIELARFVTHNALGV